MIGEDKDCNVEFEAAIERFPGLRGGLCANICKGLQREERSGHQLERCTSRMDLNPKNSNLIVFGRCCKLQRNGEDVCSAVMHINKAMEMDEKNEYAYETPKGK